MWSTEVRISGRKLQFKFTGAGSQDYSEKIIHPKLSEAEKESTNYLKQSSEKRSTKISTIKNGADVPRPNNETELQRLVITEFSSRLVWHAKSWVMEIQRDTKQVFGEKKGTNLDDESY